MAIVRQSPGIYVREIDNTISVSQPGLGGIGISARLNKGPLNVPITINSERELINKCDGPKQGFNLVSWHSISNILLYSGNILVSRVEHQTNDSQHNNSNRVLISRASNTQVGLCLTGNAVPFNFKNETKGMINNRTNFFSVNSQNANDVIGDPNIRYESLDASLFVDNDVTANLIVEDSTYNLVAKSLKHSHNVGPKEVNYATVEDQKFVDSLKVGDVYNHHGKIVEIGQDIYDDYSIIEIQPEATKDLSDLDSKWSFDNEYLTSTDDTSIPLVENDVFLLTDGGTFSFLKITEVVDNHFRVDFTGNDVSFESATTVATHIVNAELINSDFNFNQSDSIIVFVDFSASRLQPGVTIYFGETFSGVITEILDNFTVKVSGTLLPSVSGSFDGGAFSWGNIDFATISEGDTLYVPNGSVRVIGKNSPSTKNPRQLLLFQEIEGLINYGDQISQINIGEWDSYKDTISQRNKLNKENNEYIVQISKINEALETEFFVSGQTTFSGNTITVIGDVSSDVIDNSVVSFFIEGIQYMYQVQSRVYADGRTTITLTTDIKSDHTPGKNTLLYRVFDADDDASKIFVSGTTGKMNISTDGLVVTFVDVTNVGDLKQGTVLKLTYDGTTVYRKIISITGDMVHLNHPLPSKFRGVEDIVITSGGNQAYFDDPVIVVDQDVEVGSVLISNGYTYSGTTKITNSNAKEWTGEFEVLFRGMFNASNHMVVKLLPNRCVENKERSFIHIDEDQNKFKSKVDLGTVWVDAPSVNLILNYRDILFYEVKTLTNWQSVLIVADNDVDTLKKGIKFNYTYNLDSYSSYTKSHNTEEMLPSTEFARIVAVTPGAWCGTSVRINIAMCDMYHLDDTIGIPNNNTTFRNVLDYVDEDDKSQLCILLLDTDNFILEKWLVSVNPKAVDSDGLTAYMPEVINSKSTFIKAFFNTASIESEGSNAYNIKFNTIKLTELKGGESSAKFEVPRYAYNIDKGQNFTVITSHNFITNEDVVNAYNIFTEKDDVEISYLVDGEWSGNKSIQHRLIDICYARHDAIAILGPNRNDVIGYRDKETVQNNLIEYVWTNNPLVTANQASQFGGFFGNYKQVYDLFNDVYVWIPISVDVVGINAWIDNNFDPWFAAAGLRRGVLRNVVKMAWNPNQINRDGLYKNKINPVVNFRGEGNMIFGVRSCYALKSDLGDLYNRKTLNYISKNLQAMLRIALFEFNDAITRNQVVSIVEPFLRSIQARRGLTDFQIECSEANNPPEVVEQRTMVCDIYLKMASVVEVIELNFIITKQSAEFTES